MTITIGIGIISYGFIDMFINDLYIQSISGEKQLLENAGISLSLKETQIQSRLDGIIKNYSNNLNVQSMLLYQMKSNLNGVNKFHSAIDLVDELTSRATLSISDLTYVGNSASPITFYQIMDIHNSTTTDLEKEIIKRSGYTFTLSYPKSQNWYKASEQIISIGEYK